MSGKHALITGSSRGIGRGIALKLAEAGATIAIHYYQNEAAAKETLGLIKERGAEGAIFQADVTKPDQIERLFKEVRSRFSSLDIFVSNARPEAVHFFYPPTDITLEHMDAAFDSQVKGFVVGAREAGKMMSEGGRIIAITYGTGSRTGGLLPWDRPKLRWSRWCGILRSRSRNAGSRSMPSVRLGRRIACLTRCLSRSKN